MTESAERIIFNIEDFIKGKGYIHYVIGTQNRDHRIQINKHPCHSLFFAQPEDIKTVVNYFLERGVKQDTQYTTKVFSAVFIYKD